MVIRSVTNSFAYIDRVAVAPDMRGRNIGEALYGTAISRSQSTGKAHTLPRLISRHPTPAHYVSTSGTAFQEIGERWEIEWREGRRLLEARTLTYAAANAFAINSTYDRQLTTGRHFDVVAAGHSLRAEPSTISMSNRSAGRIPTDRARCTRHHDRANRQCTPSCVLLDQIRQATGSNQRPPPGKAPFRRRSSPTSGS